MDRVTGGKRIHFLARHRYPAPVATDRQPIRTLLIENTLQDVRQQRRDQRRDQDMIRDLAVFIVLSP